MEQRPEILLITDDKTVLLEMGSDGKFSVKSNAWEDNKVLLEGVRGMSGGLMPAASSVSSGDPQKKSSSVWSSSAVLWFMRLPLFAC